MYYVFIYLFLFVCECVCARVHVCVTHTHVYVKGEKIADTFSCFGYEVSPEGSCWKAWLPWMALLRGNWAAKTLAASVDESLDGFII